LLIWRLRSRASGRGAHGDALDLPEFAEEVLDQVTPFVPWRLIVEIGDTKTERIRHGD
jgi:hypothetical protein